MQGLRPDEAERDPPHRTRQGRRSRHPQRPTDTTGYTHLGARDYDPTTGRFTTVDPILDPTDPQQFNAYTYSANNPTTYTDPDGQKYFVDQAGYVDIPRTTASSSTVSRATAKSKVQSKSGGRVRPARKTKRKPLSEIAAYKQAKDPRGMINWPPQSALQSEFMQAFPFELQSQRMTVTEARMLEELNLWELSQVFLIQKAAKSMAEKLFPEEGQIDGLGDAYRHTLLNALLARELGEEWAAQWATAHEGRPENKPAEEAMDLYNNEVGRRIAAENPNASTADTMRMVYDAVATGDTVIIGGDGRLNYSSFETQPDLRGTVTVAINEASELYDGGYGYR